MLKKKLLVTAMSMDIGGAEKSLVNLLNLLNCDVFDVDLLLFQRKGNFLPQVPEWVNILSVPEIDILYGVKPQDDISFLRKTSLEMWRYMATGTTRFIERQFDRRRLLRWQKFYSFRIPRLAGRYDYAVSYSGGETFWYLVEKVEAARKIVYFHSDYSNIDIDVSKELEYLEEADLIATVSQTCAESLKLIFPAQADKVRVVQNPTCSAIVRSLANESVSDGFSNDNNKLNIISVGRLEEPKGFDMAARGAAIAKRELGTAFEWVVVGDGSQRKRIESIVAEEDIEDVFHLIGSRFNPYPYMSAADVLVQPSRFEGKSVVLDEARVLDLPVMATDYSSVRDQVRDGVDGVIVTLNPEGIADGIVSLVRNPELLHAITAGAQADDISGLEDVSGFIELLTGDEES